MLSGQRHAAGVVMDVRARNTKQRALVVMVLLAVLLPACELLR